MRSSKLILFSAAALLALGTDSSIAGTAIDGSISSAEFNPILNKLTGLISGSLGKTIAVIAFLLGVGIMAVRQAVGGAVLTCVAVAFMIGFGPTVILGLVSSGLY